MSRAEVPLPNLSEGLPSQPQRYAISWQQFKKPFTSAPSSYKQGARINRENFTPFLIDSFAISMGSDRAQELYFTWMKIHTGFDYLTTLRNFLGRGKRGWSVLSDEERSMITTATKRVDKHANTPMLLDTDEEISRSFINQLTGIAYSMFGWYFDTEEMLGEMTLEEVRRRIVRGRRKGVDFLNLLISSPGLI